MRSSPLLKPGNSQEWETPPELFEAINAEFGFQLDAAASDTNHLTSAYLTETEDSLKQNWLQSATIWYNPRGGYTICQCQCHGSNVRIATPRTLLPLSSSPAVHKSSTGWHLGVESALGSTQEIDKLLGETVPNCDQDFLRRSEGSLNQNEVRPTSEPSHKSATITEDSEEWGFDSCGLSNSGISANQSGGTGVRTAEAMESYGKITSFPSVAPALLELFPGISSQAVLNVTSEKQAGQQSPGWKMNPNLPKSCPTCKECRGITGTVWCNCPYGPLAQKFIIKAAGERELGVTTVMLIPARTDTKAWHQFIWDNKGHHPRTGVEVRFLPGRLKFRLDGKQLGPATFPSAVVVFRGG